MMLKQRSKTHVSGVVTFFVGLVLPCVFAFAQAKPFEELVPEDVSSFYSVRDYTAFVEKLKATPYHKLLNEPEVRQLIDQAIEAVSEQLDAFEEVRGFKEEVGITLEDVAGLPKGEVAVATVGGMPGPAGGAGMPQMGSMLMLVDVGNDAAEADGLIDRLLEWAAQFKESKLTDEEFQGHKIRHLAFDFGKAVTAEMGMSEEELAKLDPELQGTMREMQAGRPRVGAVMQAYVNREGNLLAVAFGTDRSLMESHLTLRDGGEARPLSESGLYKQVMARIDPASDYVAFASYKPVWDNLRQQGALMAGLIGVNFSDVMDALGIFDLEAVGSGAKLGEDGASSEGFLLVPAPRRGIMKAFVSTGGANVKPPAFVGADTALYVGAYFDAPTLWDEIKKVVVAQLPPELSGQMDAQLSIPDSPASIVQDLLLGLGRHVYVYAPADVVTITPEGALELNFVWALEVKDMARSEEAFNRLLTFMPPNQPGIEKVQVLGKTVYRTPSTPPMPWPPNQPLAPIHFLFADDKLVVAGSEAMCKQVIEGSEREVSPLLNDVGFRSLLPHLQRQPHVFAYADQRSIGAWIHGLVSTFVPPDKLQLPPYEVIGKYLSISAGTSKWDEQGLLSQSWQPYAEVAE